ncbi:MAG: biotin--[acetyl-CoA-carboxylase] ligase [Actinobacteria bacterium]|nr:biotin--[acetyl-CoA-carboxylase] ligase [Actinomycetota bacterium]
MKRYSTEMAIIKALKECKDGYISGEDLARKSSVSRAAIWKQVKNLRDKGYSIEAVPRRGYRLISSPDLLLPEEIATVLKTEFIGRRIIHRNITGSTNDLAKELANGGAEEGTVVVAEEQSHGKGRLNRSWVSPPGGIWLSVILRPQVPPSEASRFTLLAGVAAAKAIETLGIKPEIKWPNDILIGGKKVCGILLELSAQPDRVDCLIMGFGVNANVDMNKIPQESRERAITLASFLGKEIDRRQLVADLLLKLENEYRRLIAGEWDSVIADWLSRCNTLHENISLITLQGVIEGEFVGVDELGAIQIKLPRGDVKTFSAGDVTVKKRLT